MTENYFSASLFNVLINAVLLHESSASTVLITFRSIGLYRSTDGGGGGVLLMVLVVVLRVGASRMNGMTVAMIGAAAGAGGACCGPITASGMCHMISY